MVMVVAGGGGVVVSGTTRSIGAALLPLLSLLLLLPSVIVGDQCLVPQPHTFFTNDLSDMNDRLCYRCYQATAPHQLSVTLHRIHLQGLSSIMIYVDGGQRFITKDCGCQSHSHHNESGVGDAEVECQDCEIIPSGSMFEMYLRMDAKSKAPEGNNGCQQIAEFNISVAIEKAPLDCSDGFLVSFPEGGDTCAVNATALPLETRCLIPTCSEGIIAPDQLTEKVDHVFTPLAPSESCVWQLNTSGRKHLILRFSRGIRPHLTVYEESLTNPKWDMEWCPAYSDDIFRRDTDADTIFVIYHNPSKLAKQGSLSITTHTDICLLPPHLEDGTVEFHREEGRTVAHYHCAEGHTLLGPKNLTCTNAIWDEPPVCIPDKDKLMSDAPVGSVEGVGDVDSDGGGVNVTVGMSPEVGTNDTTNDHNTENKMPRAEDDEPSGDIEEESIEDEDDIEEVEIDHKTQPNLETMVEEVDVDRDLNITSLDWPLDNDYNATMGNVTGRASSDSIILQTSRQEQRALLAVLLKKFDLEEDMAIYVIGGGAILLVLLIIILIISVAMCSKSYPAGLGRRFDTFQNPIYEKAVVRVPMQPEGDGDQGHTEEEEEEEEERKKSDAEISDCTMLE